MVLGFLLYETVDVGYNILKLTYNGSTYVYNWYYNIQPETIENKIKNDEEELKETKKRLKILEDKIKELADK